MNNNKIISSVLSLILVLLILGATVFAWFTLSNQSKVESVLFEVNNYDLKLKMEVKKNNGQFTILSTKDEMATFFSNIVPNDILYFRLTLTNTSKNDLNYDVTLKNITSSNNLEEYDMLNVLYLVDGKIILDNQEIYVDKKSEDSIILFGQELNPYRFNNIVDDYFDLNLCSNQNIVPNEVEVIEYALSYDYNTSALGYQEGIFTIGSINIFIK